MSDAGTGAAIGAFGGPVGAGLGALIGSQFGNPDPSAFTSTNPKSSTAPGSIAYQGITPTQDSGTQFFRSLTNLTAQQGQQQSATGTAEAGSAANGLQSVVDYYTKLLNGDRSEISSAIGPAVDNIGSQFQNIRQMLSQNGARGGGTSSSLATLPQQQTQQISDLINKAHSGAAPGLQSAGSALASLGTNEQAMGENQLNTSITDELAKLGINLGERSQNVGMFNNAVSSLV